ncbi:hypothetical protein [Bdellovibrio sp. HCB209]|uniref:hypothetical protein n=1 Tax=Bdellovibrio sp. HCB209 TaxID=3394354 RepID=UPI0039B439AC
MKKIVLASLMSLMLGACASKSTKESCACGMEKSACSSGECAVGKDKKDGKGCAGCHAAEEKTGK